MKYKLFFIGICFFSIFNFTSCSKNKISNINLEQISQISINESWAVISSPYTTYKTEPSENADVASHGRRGDIHKILGKKIVMSEKNKKTIWYKLSDGWIEEDAIYICNNQLQANTASKKITGQK